MPVRKKFRITRNDGECPEVQDLWLMDERILGIVAEIICGLGVRGQDIYSCR